MNKEQQLQRAFIEWYGSHEEPIGMEEIADWWLSARTKELEELRKGAEAMKTDERKTAQFGIWVAESYADKMLVNAIIDSFLSLIINLQ